MTAHPDTDKGAVRRARLPSRKPKAVIARVDRARRFGTNTCPASRHVQMIGEALIRSRQYPMIEDEPEHVGGSLLSVVESLFRARSMLVKHGIDPWSGHPIGSAKDKAYHDRQSKHIAQSAIALAPRSRP